MSTTIKIKNLPEDAVLARTMHRTQEGHNLLFLADKINKAESGLLISEEQSGCSK